MALITYREAIRQALREELAYDERVYLIGEDIAEFGGSMKVTQGLFEEFGSRRVRNTPISEMAVLGAAVGSAATGLRPIVEIMYSDFFGMAMDQVFNQAAKMRYMFGGKLSMPLTIRAPMGGRRSAAAHHSQCLEAWFMHIPGIKIAMPSTPFDAKGLLKTAVRDPNTVIFFENKMLYSLKDEVPEEPFFVPFGQASLVREGSDVTVVAVSDMVGYSLSASELLAEEGISVEVIDPRTLVPLDKAAIIASVKKTGRLVVVHEAVKRGGFGGEIASLIAEEAFDYLDAPIKRVAGRNVPIAFNETLEKKAVPSAEEIAAAARSLIR